MNPNEAAKKMSECKLPVGDYVPSYLSIDYGGLQISLVRQLPFRRPAPRLGTQRRTLLASRSARTSRSCWTSRTSRRCCSPVPPPTRPVKLGDEVSVKAVLIDPKLDIMIRRLDDPSKNEEGDGQVSARERK